MNLVFTDMSLGPLSDKSWASLDFLTSMPVLSIDPWSSMPIGTIDHLGSFLRALMARGSDNPRVTSSLTTEWTLASWILSD
jgi:hypothetical protein